ncbi:hypothetical protein ACH4FX_12580 [Streptomyces sp. NPDC018019]|uniref:hypothetical protein n=1 Tax=Streptomyces sp. NPDC018019 TaxID=3365030 RepID=UPI00378FDA29
MRVTRMLAVIAAAALPLTACGGGSTEPESKASSSSSAATPQTPEIETPTVPGLGTTAHTAGSHHPIAGSGGGVLDLTPTSVVYVPAATDQTPKNGTYAVVAYKARSSTAVAAAETAPAEGGGWQWIAPDGQSVTTLDGDATSVTPAGFMGSGPVALGSYQWRSVVFDLTAAQHGGQLVYTDGEGKTYRWQMPAKDKGPEVARLKKALAG